MEYTATPIIGLHGVNMCFDSRKILSDIDLTVNRGDFIVITGPNGGGKTTLLRIILKLLPPSSGSVVYDGQLRIGYLPQKNTIDSRFPLTVREVVASGLLAEKSVTKSGIVRRVEETLRTVDLEPHADKPIGVLSGGQLQRTLLGRALISRPSVLILDEPLSYIDKQFEARLIEMLRRLSATTTVLLVSHEMSAIAPLATRHIIVDHTLHECHAHHTFIPSPCE